MTNQDSLFKIASDMVALEQLFSESNGEITPIMDEWMRELASRIGTKGEAVMYVRDQMKAAIAALKTTRDKYTDAIRFRENALERFNEHIKAFLVMSGQTKIQCGTVEYSLRNTQKKLVIDNDAAFEDGKYLYQHTEVLIDKERLRSALENGAEINYAKLEDNKALFVRVTGGGK